MRTAVMYGAGKIGRGFIGKVFADSGYGVCFLDNVSELVDAINARRRYTVRFVTNESSRDNIVENVWAIHSLTDEAVEAIADCDIMATAVGVNELPNIAPVIARAVALRRERTGRPLDAILCENQIGAGELMRGWIYAHLDAADRAWADENLGLVGASIGRMVPPQPPEVLAEERLMIRTESYDKLPVDRDAFRGALPPLVGLVPYSPFEFYIKRKLFVSNGAHALCAYLGWRKGYETIWQAMGDPEIYAAVRASMLTSAEALVAKFGEEMRENVEEEAADLLVRFQNRALGDTVARVGADVARKLRRNDRIVGAALFALEQGVDPSPIVRAILAALAFDRAEDATAPRLQADLDKRGIEYVMERYMGLAHDEALYALVLAAWRREGAKPRRFEFRKAVPGDMPELMRVVGEARRFMRGLGIDQWQDGYPDPGTLERDIEIGQLYVFAEGERVRAMAALSLLPEPVYDGIEGSWLTEGPYLTVHRMALDDDSRGHGLAGEMLDRAEALARENGCVSVRVDTHRGNAAMRGFIGKNGFEYRGVVYYREVQGDPVRVAYEKLM